MGFDAQVLVIKTCYCENPEPIFTLIDEQLEKTFCLRGHAYNRMKKSKRISKMKDWRKECFLSAKASN